MNIDKLIKGCKSGDRKSQDELVHRFAPTLMAVCMRYCKDENIAKDALQESFINIFKYIKNYSGKGSFEGWIRKIAVNCSYGFINKIRPVYFQEDVDYVVDLHTEIPDIYSELREKELLEMIQKLPRSQYLVFNMKVIEGFSHDEIADILKIGVSTSRSNLARARTSIIKMIESNDIAEQMKIGNY